MNKGMIPLTLAYEVKNEIYDYLKVLWEIKSNKSGKALEQYYRVDNPLVQGPFLQLRLPYEPAESQEDIPLSVQPNFMPYKHQKNAFERLHYKNAQNTVVTTGTGSGKTECFMFPVLDYVKAMKEQGKRGVKAIILYPMNALLDDQAKRFVEEIKEQDLADLNIRVGKYTGHKGKQKVMDYDSLRVINDVEALAKNPPDILLTNYKMLDYMLFREKEKAFWSEDTKGAFKYLILDEMHTFDGASGADVACLIRRLKMVALKEKADELVCVGTSATLSSSPDAKQELCEFATSLFGSKFEEDAIVGEIKHTAQTYLGKVSVKGIPSIFKDGTFDKGQVEFQIHETQDQYIQKLLKAFGLEELWGRPSELSTELSKYEIVHALVEVTDHNGMKAISQICEEVIENYPRYGTDCSSESLEGLIKTVVALCSYARSAQSEKFPFLTIKCSLWAQEMRRVLKKVVNEEVGDPYFIGEDEELPKGEKFLPATYCTFCGEAGWLTTHDQVDGNSSEIWIDFDSRHIMRESVRSNAYALFPYNGDEEDNVYYFYPREEKLFKKEQSAEESVTDEQNTPIRLIKVHQRHGNCPCCDTRLDTRQFAASGTVLSSLIAEDFFVSQLNADRKMISFSDSVQDATFNAAFINESTYKYTFKRHIEKKLLEGKSLEDICASALSREDFENLTAAQRVDLVGKFLPEKLKKKWQLNRNKFNFEGTDYQGELINVLLDVIKYETFSQFTLDARLGWSFENIGHSGFYLSQEQWEDLFDECSVYFEGVDGQEDLIGDLERFKQLVLGVIQRFKHQGIVYSSFLDSYYKDPAASMFPLSRRYPDLGFASHKKKQPMFFTTDHSPKYGKVRTFQAVGKGTSWYGKWLKKHVKVQRIHAFYEGLCKLLTEKDILMQVGEDVVKNGPRFVLNPEKLLFTKHVSTFRCQKCQHSHTVSDYLESVADGMMCMKNNCDGAYEAFDNRDSKKYFEDHYSLQGHRINAFEHTGSLDPVIKEFVEKEFKAKESVTPSHDINYLSCTPTMEMGIDIGNLSSVLLKSVPRNAASYLQRVGRSGRTTGNSLDFLIVDRNPHNLYFWQNPQALLNWEVQSPACRYKTGHILKRQFNAYCLDQYLHSGYGDKNYKAMPGSLKFLFSEDENSAAARQYWKHFYSYVNENSSNLLAQFVEAFTLRAGEHALGELTKYVEKGSVETEFKACFDKMLDHIKELRDEAILYKKQIKDFKKDDSSFFDKLEKGLRGEEEVDLEKLLTVFTDDEAGEIKKLYANYKGSKRKAADFQKKPLLGLLADNGVLPGYAFPESGCELEINVKKPSLSGGSNGFGDSFHRVELTRAAETAIRELAPFNTFYTHGVKAKVGRLGLFGKKDAVEELGICDFCANITSNNTCEVCNSSVEPRNVYNFKKAIASNNFDESYIGASKDKRDSEIYDVTKHFLFDSRANMDQRHRVSYVNSQVRFGFEFQSNVEIYSFNNGQLIFGEGKPFKVCQGCGAVEDPRLKTGESSLNHFRNCGFKDKEPIDLKLFRKISSDAIRFTMPSAFFAETLKAILYLGVKIHLKGDIGHIKVGSYEQGENRYLVVYDDVPGGTGHLRDFLKISLDEKADSSIAPKTFIKILGKVRDALRECKCENGCYSCLWGAHNAVRREDVSKQTAFIWLNRMLSTESGEFLKREDLGLYGISEEQSFDGHTEVMFYQILENLGKNPSLGERSIEIQPVSAGVESQKAKLTYRGQTFFIESSPFNKVELENCEIPYTKPDFTVYKENGDYAAFIYADGAGPHLNPGEEEPKFTSDILMRDALYKQAKVPVLTFTYNMLQALWDRVAEAKKMNSELSFKLASAEYKEGGTGVLEHELLAKHSFVLFFNFLDFLCEGKCFSNSDKGNFLNHLKSYRSNNIVNFDPTTLTLKVDISPESRFLNDRGAVNAVYEQHWSNFWHIFNFYSVTQDMPLKFEVFGSAQRTDREAV